MNDGSSWVSLEEAAETLGIARDEIYSYLQRNLILIHQSMHHGTYRAEVSRWDVERLRRRRELSSREPEPVTAQTRVWPRPSVSAEAPETTNGAPLATPVDSSLDTAARAAPQPSVAEPTVAPASSTPASSKPAPSTPAASPTPAAAEPAQAGSLPEQTPGSNGSTSALPAAVSTATNERLPEAMNALRRLRERRRRDRALHAEELAEMQRDRDAAVRELAQVEQHQTRLQQTLAMSERTERAAQKRCDRLEGQLDTAKNEIAKLRTKLRCALARARQFERGAGRGRD